jgi:hypothetical protein
MTDNKFEFLTSNRFWALILGSASTVLVDPEFPNREWYVNLGRFLALVSAGFIGIRTIDRATEVLSSTKEPPVSANERGD